MSIHGGSTQPQTCSSFDLKSNWRDQPYLCTYTVASLLHVKPQTVRKWACYEQGPIDARPIKIAGKLLWSTEAVVNLLQL